MAVGARDRIDQLLVKKYAKEQVDNHDMSAQSMVDPQKMMEAMNDYAAVQRNMLLISNNVVSFCSAIKAKARYSDKKYALR